ncbi:MAG: D-alanyl-D-alanine carboxypeptidase [Thermorudis peleae]|nr:D-alanyl-D-alanine carboxypeptidase [Thermorudis peleae]
MRRWLFVGVTLCISVAFWQSAAAQATEPVITADSAVVLDGQTGAILYAKDPDTPRAPASLTKIFTAIVALETAPLDTPLTVTAADLVGESSMGLHAGDHLSLRTALYGLLLASGNDAAMAIARNLGAEPGDTPQQSVARFVRQENALAEQLGLTHTHLENPHGLDQEGHVSSARDLAVITRYALRNPQFRRIISTRTYEDGQYAFSQTNRLLGVYPGLLGGKTGITDRAGYCLMEVAERDGHTIIVVLLHSTAEAWYDDARTLLDFGFAQLAKQTALPTAQPSPLVPLAPSTPVTSTQMSSTSLSVPQPATGTTVVIQSAGPVARALAHPWQWLMASLVAMGGFLCLWVGAPATLGLIGLQRSRRRLTHTSAPRQQSWQKSESVACERRTERHPGNVHHGSITRQQKAISGQHGSDYSLGGAFTLPPSTDGSPHVVTFLPAQARTRRAIRLACEGNYQEAEREFLDALRSDRRYDFTQCPGFWQMPPAGYIAAARAYRLVQRTRDARSLLMVVRLSFGSTPLLDAELAQMSEGVFSQARSSPVNS